MPFLTDIHTHQLPPIPGSALVNVRLQVGSLPFIPHQGQLYSVGLHPWDVGDATQYKRIMKEKIGNELAELLRCPSVLAVGEIGFDKLCGSDLESQYQAFVEQARMAEAAGKPVIIHQVKGIDVVQEVRRLIQARQPWIIHGFRGKPQQALALTRQGFYLSFGERYNEESLRTIPPDRLLLETDESPIPIDTIYEKAAQARGVPASILKGQIQENIRHLFPDSV